MMMDRGYVTSNHDHSSLTKVDDRKVNSDTTSRGDCVVVQFILFGGPLSCEIFVDDQLILGILQERKAYER
jgi:hypothetical protein